MAVLEWGKSGERYYETGTDRGVLYPRSGAGVPWNGLVSVAEETSGGEPRPFYLDGFKYLNIATAEEFEATIQAFSAPSEFDVCDGTRPLREGLFVTQQTRESFGFSYRTKIGNDIDGAEHGYKIHLVYNALAQPSSRQNPTIGDSVNPVAMSWKITTNPPEISGFRPSSHFVIDSRSTPPDLMLIIEEIIYGSTYEESRLLSTQELTSLFIEYGS